MLDRSTPIAQTTLRGLHPLSIVGPHKVRRLLECARENFCVFHRGLNTELDLEIAHLDRICADTLIFSAPNFQEDSRTQIFLNFSLKGRPYFFATTRTVAFERGRLTVQIPDTIFYSERRDRLRRPPNPRAGDPSRVELRFAPDDSALAQVADLSPGGMGLLVRRESAANSGSLLALRYLDGPQAGRQSHAQQRNWRAVSERPGWIRIGVVETNARAISQINPEYWLDGKNGIRVESEPEPSVVDFDELAPRLLRFSNSKGEKIVGLVDSWGDLRRSTAVVIPNGWGQTKEALLPLARTIVATFRAAGEPICVVRFDGIRKRGESHNDPECRIPGREYLHYVFSQGVEDIEEVARYLVSSKEFSVSSIILLTFSAAAIEARKALARDELGLFTAWISVVGSPDVQSMTRAISGGVDFAVGHERRTEFGIQELLGVVVNIDEIVRDGEENKLLFIEHSRNDLASISVPITWYHGQFDAWVDLNRVTDILSHGHTQNRRLILFPTGHQLKSSQQALAFFQEIACETARVGARKTVRPRRPEAREIRLLRRAERARIPASSEDLQQFWRDYLVGRDQSYGFELLADSQAYRELMDLQIRLLMLSDGHQILDLGSGVGTLPTQLAEQLATPRLLSIVSIDYVREAFDRARSRLGRLAVVEGPLTFRMSYVAADLDLRHAGQRIPIDGERFDGIIGSLLLSYLENPILVLSEIYRLLKPGGRLVISSLRRDADISKLYVDAIAELRLKGRTVAIDNLNPSALANAARNFLNDAAKILELEEMGAFQFWEQEELATLVEEAGFTCVTVDASLGTPPQAYVVSGTKR